MAGQHSGRTKETWLADNWDAFRNIFNLEIFRKSPSDTTLNRVLNNIDENLLQSCVSQVLQILLRIHLNESSIIHYPLDGKSRCGVCSELTGRTEIDLTLLEAETSSIVGKITLPDKQGEATAAPLLIKGSSGFTMGDS